MADEAVADEAVADEAVTDRPTADRPTVRPTDRPTEKRVFPKDSHWFCNNNEFRLRILIGAVKSLGRGHDFVHKCPAGGTFQRPAMRIPVHFLIVLMTNRGNASESLAFSVLLQCDDVGRQPGKLFFMSFA